MEQKTIIRHVQGNYLELRIPLTRRMVTSIDGNVDEQNATTVLRDVTVRLWRRGIARYEFTPTINDNVATVVDQGRIELGKYEIEILYKDELDHPLRYKKRAILDVVEDTADGGEYNTNEYDLIAYYPIVEGREQAIVLDGDKVYMEVGGHFGADDDPTDNKATIFTGYGEGQIVIENNKVILEI